MSCLTDLDPLKCATNVVGSTIGNAAGSVISSTGDRLAEMMRDGARWVIENTVGWWINVPSIDLNKTPVHDIQRIVFVLAVLVAVAGVMWQGIRMTLTRKPNGFVDIGRGLVTVAAWSALGITGISMALHAADQFSAWVLDQGAQGEVAARLARLAALSGVTSPGAVLVLGFVVIVVGMFQAVLMFLREGALIVLTGLVVLAAAGNFTAATRPWLQRLLAWMLALVAYKPMAAIVYYAALRTVGEGEDARTIFIGITMMVLSIFALPALLKFFSWAVPAATSTGGGGLGALAGAASTGMYAMAYAGGAGRHGSVEQAQYLRSDLGPQRGSSGGGPTMPPVMPGPAGPAGAGPSSASASSASPAAAGRGGYAGSAGASGAAGKAGAGTAGVALAAAEAARQAGSNTLDKAKDAIGEPPA
jgi:hypothetical protein